MNRIKSMIDALWIFFIFIGCTLIFYYGILWVSDEYRDYHRYDEPKGRAVKVVQQDNIESIFEQSMERLHLFLRHGE
ncbi:YqzK family protein [Evansella sp. AB-P1]|uniref:YqzK family protein n=1 Tax=Evansella sp. AB-P1 TaxID=3037653 RepID=UPI00241F07C3|nr:YqzK family protein [Evansella sp. AB-P1]MDG5787684.1 YqzK family protein [Evansella sp. AB-P1]